METVTNKVININNEINILCIESRLFQVSKHWGICKIYIYIYRVNLGSRLTFKNVLLNRKPYLYFITHF